MCIHSLRIPLHSFSIKSADDGQNVKRKGNYNDTTSKNWVFLLTIANATDSLKFSKHDVALNEFPLPWVFSKDERKKTQVMIQDAVKGSQTYKLNSDSNEHRAKVKQSHMTRASMGSQLLEQTCLPGSWSPSSLVFWPTFWLRPGRESQPCPWFQQPESRQDTKSWGNIPTYDWKTRK